MRALLTLYKCVPITTAGLSLIDIVDMIAAVAGCFSALKSSRKNLPIVFRINRELSLFRGPSTWKLCMHTAKCMVVQKCIDANSLHHVVCSTGNETKF